MTAAHGTRARCGDRADVSIGVRTSARARRCAHLCVRPWVRACGDPSPERDAGRWAVSRSNPTSRDSRSTRRSPRSRFRLEPPVHITTNHPPFRTSSSSQPSPNCISVSFIYRVF